MSTQPTERVDLAIIEALDFDHTPQCEHSNHDNHPMHGGSAFALISAWCPGCGDAVHLYLCRPIWEQARRLRCGECGIVATRDEMWQIIALVGGGS
jgi:predicted RNA-binding Zn-ribbon protein involved in translation (DUF1610 family)